MLNRIIIINSELYAKGSVYVSSSSSIQIAAENNVGKSSFLNALNFLYILDKDQMRFEDDRTLAASMKHYFDGSSLHSFIVFEIFKNGYYCILVKATPENTIEYYRISGEYRESFFIETTGSGFKARTWKSVLRDLTLDNPTDPPAQMRGDDLYNLVYNTDKNKSPVVWIKREVKRKGRAFSNSFTDIYRYLIKTSEITDRSFRNALLIANNQQEISLNVFTTSSFDKISEFEKKKAHLANLSAVKDDFTKLALLNDKYTSEEAVLGKLKNTFFKKFGSKEQELTAQLAEGSELSFNIRSLERKISVNLKTDRDELVGEKRTIRNQIEAANQELVKVAKQLKELEGYEPDVGDLMFQGLLTSVEKEERQKRLLEGRLTHLEQSGFSAKEIEKSIVALETKIAETENSIGQFDNLLYQNISNDAEIIKKAYSYLSADVIMLHKSQIKARATNATFALNFFDGVIDVSSVPLKNLPTIDDLKETLTLDKKELEAKQSQLETARNREALQNELITINKSLGNNTALVDKIKNKPVLRQHETEINSLINVTLTGALTTNEMRLTEKEAEIKKAETALKHFSDQKAQCSQQLNNYKSQYRSLQERNDVYEIEELLDEPIETIYGRFEKIYKSFAGIDGTRERRKELKDSINNRLQKDTKDIKAFIREVSEEIENIPQMDKALAQLLDLLAHEIGSPTSTFLSLFNDFKTFVYKRYNARLAVYPVSNIREVKVRLHTNEQLIEDLEKIAKLKFSDGLDFDNAYAESKIALQRQLAQNNGKAIAIADLFTVKVEILKATGELEEIDLGKQVQSRGTNIVLKLYLFLNILKELVHPSEDNKVVIYVDELDAIGQKNVKHLVRFCKEHHFVPIFAAPRIVEGIEKYYIVKEPSITSTTGRAKITFGELQSFPVIYRDAKQKV